MRAFSDSNGDGIGDLVGLIGKLDCICNLGVTATWLLPFYPSPLRDGGYDIADYTGPDRQAESFDWSRARRRATYPAPALPVVGRSPGRSTSDRSRRRSAAGDST